MTSKTIVLTGASDGIGTTAARRLVDGGHTVVVVGRSPERTASVARGLGMPHGIADFSDLEQVRALAEDLLAAHPRIDVLANNAGGIFGADRETTVDGHELTFQVNYLAPFLLTHLLLDRLAESRASVINTSSIANRFLGNLQIDDLDAEKAYSATSAYGNAKLAQILHAKELQRRCSVRGLSAVSLHPGNIATSFSSAPGSAMRRLYQTPLKHLFLTTPEKGADTLAWLAETTPGTDWVGGEYYVKRKPGKTNSQADDPALASALWHRSLDMLATH